MKTIATTFIMFLSFYAYTQVGIGTTTPDATLDIEASNVVNPASNDGILIPRIDNFPSVNPSANQDGMMVFATGNGTPTKGFYYWDNSTTSWVLVTGIRNTLDQAYDQGGAGAGRTITVDNGAVDFDGSGGIRVEGSISAAGNIVHDGDADTVITLSPDRIEFDAGGTNYIDIQDSNSEITINEDGNPTNFRVESNVASNMLFVNGSTNRVGINSLNPNSTLHIEGNMDGSGNAVFVNASNTQDGIEINMTGSSNASVDNADGLYVRHGVNFTGGGARPSGITINLTGSSTSASSSVRGLDISIPGSANYLGNMYGTYISNLSPAENRFYGYYVTGGNSGSENSYGSFNTFTGWDTGEVYGTFNSMAGPGSGSKYGSYNTISSAAGGTHYGVYSEVQSATGYAGYFIGRTSLGDGSANRYIMPALDGSVGQVMTTDGSGNLTFEDLPTFTNTDEQDLGSNVITPNEEVEITITNGTNTTINIQDADADVNNETITEATLSGTDLEIIEAGSITTIDLSSLQDGDTQNTLDQAYDEGGAGVGRIITADSGALLIDGFDGIEVSGTLYSGYVIPNSTGTKMFFNPRTASIRAGRSWLVPWDNTTIGIHSAAFGLDVLASGDYSFAAGHTPEASGNYSISIGNQTVANGINSVAIGYQTLASGNYSMSVNDRSEASGYGAFAAGQNTLASGLMSFVSGNGSQATGQTAFASGAGTIASGFESAAFNRNTDASGNFSFATGDNTSASGDNSASFGLNNEAFSLGEFVIGLYASTYMGFNQSSFNANDRLLSIGNGTSTSTRSNALTIYKSGLMNINDAYNMPLADGTAGQVMTTDGSGNVTFEDLPTFTNTDEQDLGSNVIAPNEEVEITITNGTNTTINIQDADADVTNETITSAVLSGTDLEITEAGITTTIDLSSLQDGDTQNTLDQAYDEGGAGAGRTIIADNGAINIAGNHGLTVNGNVSVGTTVNDYPLRIEVDANTNPISMYQNISGATSSQQRAVHNYFSGTNNASSVYGFSNSFTNFATSNIYGLRSDFSGNGTSSLYGMANFFQPPATGNPAGIYGSYNRYGSSSGIVRGIYNDAPGASTLNGTFSGVHNLINASGNGDRYGVFNSISGNGNGVKYGVYNYIPVSSNGTHYGIYSDTRNTSGYAGYFIGRTSFGISTTNRYLMPASDGTSGQVMTTDGSGNVTFQDSMTDTDDQQIDNFSFNSSTNILTLEMEADGQVPQTVDLSSLNPSKSLARITMSADQSFTTSTWHKLNFDTIDFDLNSEFNPTTDEFDVTSTGYYRINASWRSTNTSTSTNAFGIAIVVNGVFEGAVNFNNSGSGYVFRSINRILDLNAGDTVEIQILNSGLLDVFSNDIVTSFEIEQIR